MNYGDCCFCFACGRKLTEVDDNNYWPATSFHAHGNYGSTVHDPSPHEEPGLLEINICDPCLVAWNHRVLAIGGPMPSEVGQDVLDWRNEAAKGLK